MGGSHIPPPARRLQTSALDFDSCFLLGGEFYADSLIRLFAYSLVAGRWSLAAGRGSRVGVRQLQVASQCRLDYRAHARTARGPSGAGRGIDEYQEERRLRGAFACGSRPPSLASLRALS